jgi:hypothetical protein
MATDALFVGGLVTRKTSQNLQEAMMANNTWHYQLMRHKASEAGKMCDVPVRDYYAIHEYYPSEGGDGWTEQPIPVDGESVEEVKKVLMMMLEDIEKHGVKDCE